MCTHATFSHATKTAAVNAQGADPRLERALAEIDDLRAENAALREDLRNVRAATVTVSASAPVVFPNPFADGGGYSETAALDLVAIAGIAGVDGMALDDVLSRFAPFADANGCLSRPSFRSAWGTLVAGVGMAERSAVLGAVDDLFEMFDMNGNQEVDMAELGSGLSVLCGGSRSEKARIAFQLYDYDGDGMISLAEMVRYLTPVFTIMYETSAGAQIVVNGAGSDDVSPAELALATALGAFSDAGVHRDGVLSWPQFRLWYLSTGDSATQQDAAVASAVDIVAFRQLTGLEDMSVASALDLFAESDLSRDPTSEISLDVFEECITSEVDVAALDERSASVLHVTIATIFRTFDLDSNGLVSFAELGAGLAMLCSGSGDEKARSAFNLYDINGDGVITLDEMRRYLFSVFSVMLESNPGASATYGNASELAAITAAEAFDAVGLPRDGSMSWLQFKAWCVIATTAVTFRANPFHHLTCSPTILYAWSRDLPSQVLFLARRRGEGRWVGSAAAAAAASPLCRASSATTVARKHRRRRRCGADERHRPGRGATTDWSRQHPYERSALDL